MQIISLVWGIFSLAWFVVAFFPCLGSLNWINIPFSAVGLVVSLIAMVKAEPGKSKTGSIVGVICCSISVIVGIARLVMGGGVL